MFDCLHDMGDPLGAARRVREALAPDGTWLLVEPFAADAVEDNFTPVGRLYYSGSTFLCVPNGLSQPGGYALGAQAGEAAIRQVMTEAGSPDSGRLRRHRSTWSTRSGRRTSGVAPSHRQTVTRGGREAAAVCGIRHR
jgi:hypothetical protein